MLYIDRALFGPDKCPTFSDMIVTGTLFWGTMISRRWALNRSHIPHGSHSLKVTSVL